MVTDFLCFMTVSKLPSVILWNYTKFYCFQLIIDIGNGLVLSHYFIWLKRLMFLAFDLLTRQRRIWIGQTFHSAGVREWVFHEWNLSLFSLLKASLERWKGARTREFSICSADRFPIFENKCFAIFLVPLHLLVICKQEKGEIASIFSFVIYLRNALIAWKFNTKKKFKLNKVPTKTQFFIHN